MSAEQDHTSRGFPPALQNKFAARLPIRIRAVTDAVERAFSSDEPDDWEAARRAAHQLAGTSGSFGFLETSRRLKSLEQAILDGAALPHIRICLRDISEACAQRERTA